MDEIARLLDNLAAGHLTAAVPLLDIFREEAMWNELRTLVRLVASAEMLIERGHEPSYLRGHLDSEVRRHFWHLMNGRDARLAEAESYLLGPDPEPGGNADGPPPWHTDGDSYPQAEPPHPGWAALGSPGAPPTVAGNYPPIREITITETDGPPSYNPEAP